MRSDDGTLRNVLTDGSRTGLAFPFELPAAPGPGDNQALVVNTGDGTVVYDVAVALVWVKDGEVADKVQAALSRLDGLEEIENPYAQVKAVEAEILTLLIDSGLVERQETTAAGSATASPTTTLASGGATTATLGPSTTATSSSLPPAATVPAVTTSIPRRSSSTTSFPSTTTPASTTTVVPPTTRP